MHCHITHELWIMVEREWASTNWKRLSRQIVSNINIIDKFIRNGHYNAENGRNHIRLLLNPGKNKT